MPLNVHLADAVNDITDALPPYYQEQILGVQNDVTNMILNLCSGYGDNLYAFVCSGGIDECSEIISAVLLACAAGIDHHARVQESILRLYSIIPHLHGIWPYPPSVSPCLGD